MHHGHNTGRGMFHWQWQRAVQYTGHGTDLPLPFVNDVNPRRQVQSMPDVEPNVQYQHLVLMQLAS